MSDKPDPVCSDCIGFQPMEKDDQGRWRGRCAIRGELGMVPEELPYCHVFKVRHERAELVRIPAPAKKARAGGGGQSRPERPTRPARPTLDKPTTGDTDGEISMDRDGLKQVLRELLEEETLYGYPEVGVRWEGGTLVLKPADADQQAKEVPVEAFFHKIVMVRDRLRVLEAKLNGHSKLSEADKVEMQSYITRCYGSLTTFNILFSDKADHFNTKG